MREFAAGLCEPCPVRVECEVAGRTERHGVWGGIDRTKSKRDREEGAA